MASKTSYELHHNFPKLANESGFAFNIHRPRAHVEWNKIRLIDIDNLVRERKFSLIEQHISDILNCALESEFDVRILNEGVLKMFRLAQLAVEYQQFCRHYLDRSVFVLKEEISALIQELENTKKDLQDKDEEIRKLKKKTKHSYRMLPYGNDNIAAMILKTLSQKNEFFPSTSNGNSHQYNRCSFCDKVFLNQLYLKSHISRRHTNVEMPQRDIQENVNNDNRLSEEITELKNKLKEMESFINENKRLNENAIANNAVDNDTNTTKTTDAEVGTNTQINSENNTLKKTKDAEVSTNKDAYLLDKIEEWKKEEHEKYNKEINLLRTQILDTINSLKDKETKTTYQNEPNVVDLLHKTICEQGTEIMTLRDELNNSKMKSENENSILRKEAAEQLAFWTKCLEAQSKQHDLLLQKLNNIGKEAQESRQQAEREKERAEYLKKALHESINNKQYEENSSDDNAITINKRVKGKKTEQLSSTSSNKKQSYQKPDTVSTYRTVSDRKTLETLHQEAQQLLNLERINLSSSDISSEAQFAETIPLKKPVSNPTLSENCYGKKKQNKINKHKEHTNTKTNHLQKPKFKESQTILKSKEEKLQDNKPPIPDAEKNGQIFIPRSPMKVVRAKITEEVNNRIVSAGMDPLKIRLPKNDFHKQRLVLQQQQELKSKKNPAHENVKHSILAYLDSAVSSKDNMLVPVDYNSPNKESKTMKFKSVLSNVKNKALSLVKSSDGHPKIKQKLFQPETVKKETINGEVAKRALALLKTPPGSAHSSPAMHKNSPNEKESSSGWDSNSINVDKRKSELSSVKENKRKSFTQSKSIVHDDTSSSDAIESDHKHYKASHKKSKSIDKLIRSPARRPASAEVDYNHSLNKYSLDNGDIGLTGTQSAINVSSIMDKTSNKNENLITNIEHDIHDRESLKDIPIKQAVSDENIQNIVKLTKGVLKNALSTSSLNKKKVLFDMDAIQMKSVSASPSQSITEKSEGKDNYELGLINLDGEEWDISSIENEPLKNDTKIQVNNRTSPKIAELKRTIESQLARRNETPSTVRLGGVDIAGPMIRIASSIGGSNTSLGSSILDESVSIPAPNHSAFVKPKNIPQKEDSEVDISEFSIDGTGHKNESF